MLNSIKNMLKKNGKKQIKKMERLVEKHEAETKEEMEPIIKEHLKKERLAKEKAIQLDALHKKEIAIKLKKDKKKKRKAAFKSKKINRGKK